MSSSTKTLLAEAKMMAMWTGKNNTVFHGFSDTDSSQQHIILHNNNPWRWYLLTSGQGSSSPRFDSALSHDTRRDGWTSGWQPKLTQLHFPNTWSPQVQCFCWTRCPGSQSSAKAGTQNFSSPARLSCAPDADDTWPKTIHDNTSQNSHQVWEPNAVTLCSERPRYIW